jgi:hypothetical protein
MKRKLKIGSASITIVLIVAFFTITFAQSSGDSIYSLVKLASDIAFKINARYVDKPDIEDLIHSGTRPWTRFRNFWRKKISNILWKPPRGNTPGWV